MVIRFLRDFRSAATDENFYTKGQTADLERGAEVVTEGAAEFVPIDARAGQVEPQGVTPAPAPKKAGRR